MNIDLAGISQIIAVITSPLIAIFVTDRFKKSTQIRKEKMACFLTLLFTRHLIVDDKKTGALNSIHILFSKEKAVIDAWDELYDVFHQPNRLQDADLKLNSLLNEMAKVLGYKYNALDLTKKYIPTGKSETEEVIQKLKDFINTKSKITVKINEDRYTLDLEHLKKDK